MYYTLFSNSNNSHNLNDDDGLHNDGLYSDDDRLPIHLHLCDDQPYEI